MSCRDKISDRCTTKLNAVCVKYEGTLHADTELDVNDCHTLEEVIEDINTELDDINVQIDVTALGDACIEYTPAGDELSVSDVLLEHEAQLCALIEATGINDPAPCPTCVDPCADDTTGNCNNGLVYYGYGVGEFFISNITYPGWNNSLIGGYEELTHTIAKSGTYKVTLDVGCDIEDVGGRAFIGISVNNIDPIVSAFAQYEIIPPFNSKTFHFILPAIVKGDILRVKFKGNVAGSISVDGVKVIIEKVA